MPDSGTNRYDKIYTVLRGLGKVDDSPSGIDPRITTGLMVTTSQFKTAIRWGADHDDQHDDLEFVALLATELGSISRYLMYTDDGVDDGLPLQVPGDLETLDRVIALLAVGHDYAESLWRRHYGPAPIATTTTDMRENSAVVHSLLLNGLAPDGGLFIDDQFPGVAQ